MFSARAGRLLSDIRNAKLRFRHMGGQPLPPQGWHPDPSGAPQLRYFDGHAWAEHYAPAVAPQRMSDAGRAAGSPPRAASAGEPGSAGARMITSPQRRLYSLNQIRVPALLGSPFPGFCGSYLGISTRWADRKSIGSAWRGVLVTPWAIWCSRLSSNRNDCKGAIHDRIQPRYRAFHPART